MTFNPPPPFDPFNQTSYEPWYDMINSIVGFVTASTHLASTLRNNHCCFPDRLEITELFGDKEKANDQVFDLIDFPWFLKELTTAPNISTEVAMHYHVSKTVPLIQFPLCGISQGEPSTEPRSIALIDTRDFGDVDYEINNNYRMISDTHLSTFQRSEFPKSEASNQSCFFEEFTDSNQTIDSMNLQENYEQIETTEGKINSQKDSLNKLSSGSFIDKMKNSFQYLKDLQKNEEKPCTMYNPVTDAPSGQEELYLECHVEEILIVENQQESEVENKEEGISTDEDLLDMLKSAKYYSIESIPSKESNKNYTTVEKDCNTDDNIVPKLEKRFFIEEKLREKSNSTISGNLSHETRENENNKENRTVENRNYTTIEKDCNTEDSIDLKLEKRCFHEKLTSTVDENCESHKIRQHQNKEKIRIVENKHKFENEQIPNLEVGNETKKVKTIITGRRKNEKIKHKTKKIMAENVENIIPISNKSGPLYNLLEQLNANSMDSCYALSDDTENQKLADIKKTVNQETKRVTRRGIRKKVNAAQVKQNTRNLKEDIFNDSVDYITKNIVNCLNLQKKIEDEKTKKEKSDLSTRSKTPLKGRKGITKVLKTSSPTDINIHVRTILQRSSKLLDQTPLMENTVKTGNTLYLKPNNETRNLTVKRSSNKSRPISAQPSRTEEVHKILDSLPTIKSCLKSGKKKINGRVKTCVINEEHHVSENTKTSNITTNSNSKIRRKLPLTKDTTLKLKAAENVMKATELLRTAEEVLRPTTTMKRKVASGSGGTAPFKSRQR